MNDRRRAEIAERLRAKQARRAEKVLALWPGKRVERIATGVLGEIIATPTAGPILANTGTVLVRFVRRIEQLDAHLLRPAQDSMEG